MNNKNLNNVVIRVNKLSKDFGRIKAVKNLNFSVKKSETLALLGSNGAGKTTTLMMLMGILKPTYGEVNILNYNVFTNRKMISREINFACPFIELPQRLTVRQNLTIYGHLYGVENLSKKIYKLSIDLELGDILDIRLRKLSTGQKTRVSLAKALINDPKILFLDEPTASLDPDHADRIRTYLEDYQLKTSATIVLASHNMPEVERLCSNVLMMKLGTVVDEGPPKKLINQYGRSNLEEVFLTIARTE
ncbi:MAG: Ribosome-associated ATPase [Alphaproteobacteria bacterium MarineAlpha9_Bin2]|nr:MAG: Ribosome-associated ATPase [Alphaproteobacteria bacterium MarineAlpha9_Bin1]PPR29407.1 MAG: Ribosome-associated ATPase [Alphaproteobacteria bacterium MarineAlpha9_Bin2]